MSVLIKREAIAADRREPIEMLPSQWTGPHVARRLRDGITTLEDTQPDDRWGLRGSWPPYTHEWEDLLAQMELSDEERATALETSRRCISSTQREIEHAIMVTYWPAKYLAAKHRELCAAVNAVAHAYASGRDAGAVAKKRGGCADTWRQRHDRGCEIIAAGLIKDRVKVF
jgi:hypothetical protein